MSNEIIPDVVASFEKRFPNQFSDLEKVNDESVEWLKAQGASPHTLYLSRFVIEELGTNIIKYGYDDDAAHEIFLQMQITLAHLHILLDDDGHKFDPLQAPKPKVDGGVESRTPGGLGIWLVQKFGTLGYERTADGHNQVRIVLRLDHVGA